VRPERCWPRGGWVVFSGGPATLPGCGVCRWTGTAAPAMCGAGLTVRSGRWVCPQAVRCPVAGSCRPTPDRQSEATFLPIRLAAAP